MVEVVVIHPVIAGSRQMEQQLDCDKTNSPFKPARICFYPSWHSHSMYRHHRTPSLQKKGNTVLYNSLFFMDILKR